MFRCLFGDLSQTIDSKNQFLVLAMFKTVLLTMEKSFCQKQNCDICDQDDCVLEVL